MYLWATSKLAEQIKNNALTESNKKNYLVVGGVITALSTYIAMFSCSHDVASTLVAALIYILILVVGINLTFRTNAGGDYIARFVVLSVPITIKIYLAAGVLGLLLGVLSYFISIEEYFSNEWFSSFFTFVFQIVTFWRINVHLAYIAK